MNRGVIIPGLVAIEGIDGSGKTCLTHWLQDALHGLGHTCVIGHEPTDGPVGMLLRDYLRGFYGEINHESLELLFAADRIQHLNAVESHGILRLLRPQLSNSVAMGVNSDRFYITDRYIYSALVYGSRINKLPIKFIEDCNRNVPLPEKVIFLEISLEDALPRLEGRNLSHFDYYEVKSKLQYAIQGFKTLIRRYHEVEVLVLDATMEKEEMVKEALEFVVGEVPE